MNKEVLEDLIEEGLSTYKIADRLGKGQTTVRYWLKKHGLKTILRIPNDSCVSCGFPLQGNQTKYCKTSCKTKAHYDAGKILPAQYRRGMVKRIRLIKLKGGKCEKCGYNKNVSALTFHHREPDDKEIKLSQRECGAWPWDKLVKEANKCDLFCHNCHSEHHHPEMFNWESEDFVEGWLRDKFST